MTQDKTKGEFLKVTRRKQACLEPEDWRTTTVTWQCVIRSTNRDRSDLPYPNSPPSDRRQLGKLISLSA